MVMFARLREKLLSYADTMPMIVAHRNQWVNNCTLTSCWCRLHSEVVLATISAGKREEVQSDRKGKSALSVILQLWQLVAKVVQSQ